MCFLLSEATVCDKRLLANWSLCFFLCHSNVLSLSLTLSLCLDACCLSLLHKLVFGLHAFSILCILRPKEKVDLLSERRDLLAFKSWSYQIWAESPYACLRRVSCCRAPLAAALISKKNETKMMCTLKWIYKSYRTVFVCLSPFTICNIKQQHPTHRYTHTHAEIHLQLPC